MNDKSDAIEIIGRACRLPGANNVSEFWDVLKQGRCTVGRIGEDRWSTFRYFHPRTGEQGKSYTFAAGVLDDIWGFDPGVFGVSPREAEQMDPQQRLLLQIVWEALEDAGIPASGIAGRDVGVFVGASSLDYGNRRLFDPVTSDAYFMTGNTLSLISNRISYIFDLHGPSFTVDTACSSSLVALNEAVEALRDGQIETAVVAGVNALLTPFPYIGFSAAHMLSPEGLCRPFDAGGEGYVRAEGCVAFILQRADAEDIKGQHSYGRIVASGVNSDGRTNGIALPSSESQAALLEKLYKTSKTNPDDLLFVEAHGTGTKVGDPAEAQALGRVLGQKRKQPLLIGSVKSNIGHLEPAAGLAGMLKAILALEHNSLPASLHYDTPNPDIAFDELNLKVASKPVKLSKTASQTHVGISTFGFGGTNAHVIVKRPEPQRAKRSVRRAKSAHGPDGVLLLSAHSKDALKQMAERYRDMVASTPDQALTDLTSAVFHRRDRLNERLAVSGDSTQDIADGLSAFIADEHPANIATGRSNVSQAKVAFAYSGNGSQWPGMAKVAYAENEDFRRKFKETDRLFKKLAGWSLIEMLNADDLEQRLNKAEVAQALLFASQVSLTAALREMGLEPAAVFGHSAGEIAAAEASGALDLEHAVNLIHKRSLHMELVRHTGTMAALVLSEEDARQALSETQFSELSLAAVNSPRGVTLSGSNDQIKEFARIARRERGWACRVLKIEYPYHSSIVDTVREPLVASLEGLTSQAGDIPFISTVTGDIVAGQDLDIGYWWRNARETVLFPQAVLRASELGCQAFIEIGPRPVLKSYVTDTLNAHELPGTMIHSLDMRDPEGTDPVRSSFARALANGAEINTGKAFSETGPYPVKLPHYPWQNKPFKIKSSQEATAAFETVNEQHPLLGWRVLEDDVVWHTHIDPHLVPYLADHKVDGKIIVPGAGFVEMAHAAGREWLGTDLLEIRNMDITQPMVLDNDHITEVKLQILPDTASFEIASRRRLSDDPWQVHATCNIAKIPGALGDENLTATPPPPDQPSGADRLYATARRLGLDYGPSFQLLKSVDRIDGDTLHVAIHPTHDAMAGSKIYGLHPISLDACFHGLIALFDEISGADLQNAFIPVRFGRIRVYDAHCGVRSATIHVERRSKRSIRCRLSLHNADGGLIAVVDDARFVAVPLRRSMGISELAYHHSVETVGLAGYERAATVPGIAQLVRHAKGLNAPKSAPEEEAKRLIEVAAHRAAYDAVQSINKGNARINPDQLIQSGRLLAEYKTLFCALVIVLEDAGIARQDDDCWSIASESGLPAVADILNAVLEENADRLTECVMLARAAELLPRVISGEKVFGEDALFTSATIDHFVSTASQTQALVSAVTDLAKNVAQNWERDRPLRILEIGIGGGALTRALAPLVADGRGRLVATDTNKSVVDRIAIRFAGNPAVEVLEFGALGENIAEFGPFDMLVSANGLHRLAQSDSVLAKARANLVSGGLMIAAEPNPDAFHDVTFGLDETWFERSLNADFPMSALRSSEEWLTTLQRAGYLSTRALPLATNDGTATILLAKSEKDADAPSVDAEQTEPAHIVRPVLIVADDADEDGRLAEALETILRERGRRVVRIKPAHSSARNGALSVAPEFSESWDVILSNQDAVNDGAVEIVHLDAAYGKNNDPLEALRYRASTLSALLRALDTRSAKIWIAAPGGARGAARLGEDVPAQSGIWSFARTARNEYANADLRLLDFEAGLSTIDNAERIAALIDEPGLETELIVGRNSAKALRVRRDLPASGADTEMSPASTLTFARSGDLNQLSWQPKLRQMPAAGEVEIEVVATGLNFRDVMWTLGMLPEEALEDGFAGPTLGFECSGRIANIGDGVSGFAVGDPVIAFAPACFSSHVTVQQIAVARLPEHTDLLAAATIPVPFLTAYYALHHLGRLEQDEWVLIHGGAGGVGLAALQIALWRGAKIIATAGSDEKRQFLKMLGATHVFDSRSLEFPDQVMEVTGGEGVDVVLNSLSGEAMERSISVIRPFGRFLELGKRDYYGNTKIGLRPFRRNLSYFGIDADQLLVMQPALGGKLFGELMELFNSGEFTPLPYRCFSDSDVVEAFRLMQQSGHIGKILITPPQPGTIQSAPKTGPFTAAGEGAHIITGGLGGFGLSIAAWLAECGARTIILTSRTGVASDEAQTLIKRLGRRGVDIRVEKSDVTDRASLKGLLSAIRDEMPIRGVIHAAMILEDSLIQGLDSDKILSVLRPKVVGAQHLDELTRDDLLDYFVLFSSVATLIGNPGQASYVAANAFMEGLARRRRAEGLPALAVGWGAITDVGYLARNKELGDIIVSRTGGNSFSANAALSVLSDLITRKDQSVAGAVVTIAPMDWSIANQELPIMQTRPFHLIARHQSGAALDETDQVDVADLIEGLNDRDARDAVGVHLAREVARLLHLPDEDINLQRPLTDIGVDSLMVFELRMSAQKRLGVEIPLGAIAEGTTLNDIAAKIVGRIKSTGLAQPVDEAQAIRQAVADRHISAGIDLDSQSPIADRIKETEDRIGKIL